MKTPLGVDSKINNTYEQEIDKLKTIKLHMAKKNRKITALQRRLDEVPSRAELSQYQRRFLELYSQGKKHVLYCKSIHILWYSTGTLLILDFSNSQLREDINSCANY